MNRKRLSVRHLIFLFGVFCFGLQNAPAHALSLHPNVKRVIVFGAYGTAFGTLGGLVSLPLSRDWRTLFLGSSVGLYLGLAVGIVYAATYSETDHLLNRIVPGSQAGLSPSGSLEITPRQPDTPKGWQQSDTLAHVQWVVAEF